MYYYYYFHVRHKSLNGCVKKGIKSLQRYSKSLEGGQGVVFLFGYLFVLF